MANLFLYGGEPYRTLKEFNGDGELVWYADEGISDSTAFEDALNDPANSITPYDGSPEQIAADAAADAAAERDWRNRELVYADHQINIIEDAAGDASTWKTYRQELRDWPADGSFPDIASRPTRPV